MTAVRSQSEKDRASLEAQLQATKTQLDRYVCIYMFVCVHVDEGVCVHMCVHPCKWLCFPKSALGIVYLLVHVCVEGVRASVCHACLLLLRSLFKTREVSLTQYTPTR